MEEIPWSLGSPELATSGNYQYGNHWCSDCYIPSIPYSGGHQGWRNQQDHHVLCRWMRHWECESAQCGIALVHQHLLDGASGVLKLLHADLERPITKRSGESTQTGLMARHRRPFVAKRIPSFQAENSLLDDLLSELSADTSALQQCRLSNRQSRRQLSSDNRYRVIHPWRPVFWTRGVTNDAF